MRAGNAYHRIKFFKKVSTRDTFGASVDTYEVNPSIETRGEIRWVGGNQQLLGDEKFFAKNMELTIRYRAEIDETYEVEIDDKPTRYQISYIEELGRHDSLRLTLNKMNV